MSKIEKECKILNIDVDVIKNKLKEIGATFIEKKKQKIYVYDIPTLYYRYLEIKELLKSKNKLLVKTNKEKLKTLLIECEDLISEKELNSIKDRYQLKSLLDIINQSVKEIIKILNDKEFKNSIKKLKINPNKWIRLRQSNKKIELTCKHIIENTNKNFQEVHEIEFNVSDFNEANLFLESIGISKRSYQEKIRYSYTYKGAEIEIDLWPMLEPYVEIECDNDKIIKEIIDKLELKYKKVVSINTEELYREKGIDINTISELKF